MGQLQKKGEDRRSNKRADRKVESNDIPGIPDRGETSEAPGLLSGQGHIDLNHENNKSSII